MRQVLQSATVITKWDVTLCLKKHLDIILDESLSLEERLKQFQLKLIKHLINQ